MAALVKSGSNLPVLELVQFIKVALYRRDALLLYICLMKKKLVRSILMVDTQMDEYVASRMLRIFKDSDECDQL
jgi:hypothetical protein